MAARKGELTAVGGPAATVAVGTLGIAGIAVLLPTGAELGMRGLAWLLAAVAAAMIGSRRRREPSGSWLVIAAGAALVAISWIVRAPAEALRPLGEWPDFPAGLGLLTIGVGLLLAGRDRRERVALLDGAILAGAVLTFVWATLLSPRVDAGTPTDQVATAALFVAGAILVMSVAVARILAGRHVMDSSALFLTFASSAVLVAGVGRAWQGLGGDEQATLGRLAWIVAPLLLGALAGTPQEEQDQPGETPPRMTTTRFGLLVLLTLMPALTVGILGISPGDARAEVPVTLGLWATSASVALLAARIRLTADFAIEDERQATLVRHQRLIEYSADLVALLTKGGEVFYASPAMVRLLGHLDELTSGVPFARFVAADDREDLVAGLMRAATLREQPLPVRLQLVGSDGTILPTEGTLTDLTEVDGVNGVVVTLRDVSERMSLEEELRRAALQDPLTSLANRTLVTDRAAHALSRRGDEPSRVGFLYLDVDDFKTINDGLGHHAGDAVLETVAERIRRVVRDADTPGRLGGDEFAVLLESLPADDPVAAARRVADRLAASMEEPIDVAGESLRVRASMGLAMGAPDMTVDELVHNADMAMYQAKQEGDGLALYDERMGTRARRRLLLTQDLEAAIAGNTLTVDYQPIVELPSRTPVAVEALLRWQHPRLGAIAASEMEELAVRGGLADDLTRWTFQRVRADRDAWQGRFARRLSVAINLAAQQLSPSVVELFEDAFGDRPGGAASGIQIELTETALLRDANRAADVLAELRAHGAEIAIDDFGTGYASLSYLRRLPVDILKIDREFIGELENENVQGSYASLIRDLAVRLDLQTVAEGIETEQQCRAAVVLGCERGQGWLFGRPMGFAELMVFQTQGVQADVPAPRGRSRSTPVT